MTDDYKTVKNEACDEFTEKRSRFIGYCKPVRTEQEAVSFINEIRSKHRDARHNVSAYSVRENNIMRCSDDGEPSGTAGMPALEVILKNGISDVCVVITRYFGGVLLGTGGLARAYSQAAKLALAAAEPVLMEKCAVCSLSCSYNQYGKVSAVVSELAGGVDDVSYGAAVELKFHIKPESLSLLSSKIADATAGEAEIITEKEDFFPDPVKIFE